MGNFRSRGFSFPELSFPGIFVPPDYFSYEPQTAVTTVRICFVVGLRTVGFPKKLIE